MVEGMERNTRIPNERCPPHVWAINDVYLSGIILYTTMTGDTMIRFELNIYSTHDPQ